MRESVQWFAGQMENELAKHDEERGEGWKGDGILELFNHLEQEVRELKLAIDESAQSGEINREWVIEECADLANMAMMIADNSREK